MISTAGITLKQLRALAALAQTRSITRAASHLGLTPPAVHTQLRTLENSLGCAVVVKAKTGMELTAEGHLILQAQNAIEASLSGAVNQITAMQKGLAGAVTLGVVSTGKYFAPRLLAGIKKSFQDIDIKLIIGNRDEILRALSERSVDLAIMGRPPRVPVVHSKAIGVHPMLMVAAPDSELSGLDFVPAERLLEQVIISREEGSGTRILMTRYLDRIGEGTPYETMEMGSNETIKQAVMAGLGIAMISQHTVNEELKSGRLVAVRSTEMPIERQWFAVHRVDQTLSPAMQIVWDFIVRNCQDYFPTLDKLALAPGG